MVNHKAQKLASLKRSSFRSRFKLDNSDILYIRSKGIKTIRDHADHLINSRIAPQFPKNDGKQTPMKGHPVFIAQHATATCCRSCIERCHGIKKGEALTNNEITYIVDAIMKWIGEQIKTSSTEP
jgi:predicted molibdopterin-dependent oxidoreductase YjgC